MSLASCNVDSILFTAAVSAQWALSPDLTPFLPDSESDSANTGLITSLLVGLFTYLLSTHADRQAVNVSFTVRFFVIMCVCAVTDFSTEDKASGVKFCTVVHQRPGQRISHYGELCSPDTQNRTNRPDTVNKVQGGKAHRNVTLECAVRGIWRGMWT